MDLMRQITMLFVLQFIQLKTPFFVLIFFLLCWSEIWIPKGKR